MGKQGLDGRDRMGLYVRDGIGREGWDWKGGMR